MHFTEPPISSTLSISACARLLDLVGERLDEVGAGERVGGVGGARLVGEDLLGAQRDPRGASRSAAPAPRRSRSCAATGCRRTPRRSPGAPRARCCSRGCCAASVTPPVWVWKRIFSERSSLAPKRSRMIRAHIRRAARNFATSWNTLLWPLKKKASRGPNSSTSRPGVDRRLHVGDRVGEREAHLLHRRAALLAHVVAGDRDRVPLRDALAAVGEQVGGQAHRRARAGR